MLLLLCLFFNRTVIVPWGQNTSSPGPQLQGLSDFAECDFAAAQIKTDQGCSEFVVGGCPTAPFFVRGIFEFTDFQATSLLMTKMSRVSGQNGGRVEGSTSSKYSKPMISADAVRQAVATRPHPIALGSSKHKNVFLRKANDEFFMGWLKRSASDKATSETPAQPPKIHCGLQSVKGGVNSQRIRFSNFSGYRPTYRNRDSYLLAVFPGAVGTFFRPTSHPSRKAVSSAENAELGEIKPMPRSSE